MPVGAAGAREAEAIRDADPALALRGVVRAVKRLDAAEAGGAVALQHRDRAVVVEVRVRERHRRAGGAPERDGLVERQRTLRDVDGAVIVEVARERVLA
ncbi:MAG: hypothetical protein KIT31_21310 [Deltaproteobacteria bacterium]|nr:hypothetical protein [Deltaproteobacteria bacterium]